MKVLLTEDHPQLGKAGDVVEVRDGYARNFLFPQGLAVPVTGSVLRNLEAHRRTLERKRAREAARRAELAARLEGARVRVTARAGRQGRIYGTITARTIQEALREQLEVEVDPRRIEIPQPIRILGEHEIRVHLSAEARPSLIVEVVPEANAGA